MKNERRLISRDKFVQILKEIFSDKLEDFLELFQEGKIITTDNFNLYRNEEEIYIVSTKYLYIINWYKLYHIGRCLSFSYNISEVELKELLTSLKRELIEYECL